MGAADTDVALETADIALTHDDISKLPWLVGLFRRMLKIIQVNIVFGLLFDAAAVVCSFS
jgi:Cd2+/Zn2+-exporting ATPase